MPAWGRLQPDGEMGRQDGDFYAVLAIERDATNSEIARAYRRAARATHPDTHPHEPTAAERFRTIVIAYETLGNPRHRAAYDRTRPAIQRGDRWEPSSHFRPPAATPVQLGRKHQSRPTHHSPTRVDPVRHAAQTERDLVALATLLSRLNWRWRLFEASHPCHSGRRWSH